MEERKEDRNRDRQEEQRPNGRDEVGRISSEQAAIDRDKQNEEDAERERDTVDQDYKKEERANKEERR